MNPTEPPSSSSALLKVRRRPVPGDTCVNNIPQQPLGGCFVLQKSSLHSIYNFSGAEHGGQAAVPMFCTCSVTNSVKA